MFDEEFEDFETDDFLTPDELDHYASSFSTFMVDLWPWGEGELVGHQPEQWQLDFAREVDAGLSRDKALRLATASGHGVGKSALVGMLICWAMCTEVDTRVVVTANNETQLRNKTWPELAKWFRRLRKHCGLKWEATSLFSTEPGHEKTWRADLIPKNPNNPEGFAGLHNQGRRILLVFDEASGIEDIIWETAEGALTDKDTEIIWAIFGNPMHAEGRFKECFPGGRFAHRWQCRRVDSREVTLTDKEYLEGAIADYGLDSDYVRSRVLGEFPRNSTGTLISDELAREAALRPLPEGFNHEAVIMAIDVARFGDDCTVFAYRQGRDARSIAWEVYRGLDTTQVAHRIAEAYQRYRPDAIVIDGGGIGGGVVDACRNGHGLYVHDIQFGARADYADPTANQPKVANKRAEIWVTMRDNLATLAIPNHPDLIAQLCSPMYAYNNRDEILLERKQDMKRRGLASPDMGDALALTYAVRGVQAASRDPFNQPKPAFAETEYDPFGPEALNDRPQRASAYDPANAPFRPRPA